MTLEEVKRLISEGEGQHIEFKRKVAFPEKVIKEIVAFANSSGGYLFVGIDDDGTVYGSKIPDEEVFALNTAIDQYCKPRIQYTYELVPVSAKRTVIVYHVAASKKKPHYVIEESDSSRGKAFVRVDDRSIQASREVREIIKRQDRGKGVRFSYGDHEKWLMNFLAENDQITLKQFINMTNVNKFRASKTLVLLVLANVLRVHPEEKEDFYSLQQYD
ncbi:MAG: ATP-binding protein [Bacteroidota bacterium]